MLLTAVVSLFLAVLTVQSQFTSRVSASTTFLTVHSDEGQAMVKLLYGSQAHDVYEVKVAHADTFSYRATFERYPAIGDTVTPIDSLITPAAVGLFSSTVYCSVMVYGPEGVWADQAWMRIRPGETRLVTSRIVWFKCGMSAKGLFRSEFYAE